MQAPGEKAQYEPGPPSYEGQPVFHPLPPLEDPDECTFLPSYPSALPQKFPIGPTSTAPLVSTTYKLESHLRLLGAFHQLREDVGGGHERWTVFVGQAVERFEKWYRGVVCREGREAGPLIARELPPLDVAMVWHSYCLNPALYLEDGLTRNKPLLDVQHFQLSDISATLDPLTLRPLDASDDQLRTFEFLTSEPFIPPLNETKTEIQCPRCQALLSVPWIAADCTGFAQPEFKANCESCELVIGKEAMGVRRFCEHLTSWISNREFGIPVAGTLLDHATGLPDYTKAIFFNRRLLRVFLVACKGKTASEIGEYVHWNLSEVETCCRTGMHAQANDPGHPRLRRMLNYYRHPGSFSVDLVGATLRQGAFVLHMHSLGWTEPTRFAADSDKGPLIRANARYHAWVDLMSVNPGVAFVPTLDIDLVWHTHMLFALLYRNDMERVLGRIPDHDDKVEEGALGDAFDDTARAWRLRFGVPYTYCGCLEGSDEPRSTLSKLRTSLLQPREATPADLDIYKPSAIASTAPFDAGASHGSEHNSVIVIKNPQLTKSRSDKHSFFKKRADALRANAAGGDDSAAWDQLRLRRHGRNGHFVPFRARRPGPGVESAEYVPWLLDGSLAGANCAAGVPGGICQVGMQGVGW